MIIVDLFEALTICCFGLSWPISIYKSLVSRTAKGKSLLFEVFLLIGYAFGIARKIIQMACLGEPKADTWYGVTIFVLSFVFYIINFIAISIDVALYFRNRRLDKAREAGKEV